MKYDNICARIQAESEVRRKGGDGGDEREGREREREEICARIQAESEVMFFYTHTHTYIHASIHPSIQTHLLTLSASLSLSLSEYEISPKSVAYVCLCDQS